MLGSPEFLPISTVLSLSVSGLAIVFLCLACLILAIKVMGAVFSAADKNKKPAAAPAPKAAAPAAPAFDEETYAVLLSTVSHASGLPLDKFRIVSVTEM